MNRIFITKDRERVGVQILLSIGDIWFLQRVFNAFYCVLRVVRISKSDKEKYIISKNHLLSDNIDGFIARSKRICLCPLFYLEPSDVYVFVLNATLSMAIIIRSCMHFYVIWKLSFDKIPDKAWFLLIMYLTFTRLYFRVCFHQIRKS